MGQSVVTEQTQLTAFKKQDFNLDIFLFFECEAGYPPC